MQEKSRYAVACKQNCMIKFSLKLGLIVSGVLFFSQMVLASEVVIKNNHVHQRNERLNYKIDIVFPTVSGKDVAAMRINRKMRNAIRQHLQGARVRQFAFPYEYRELTNGYLVTRVQKNVPILNVRFVNKNADGYMWPETYVFNMNTGARIKLFDVIKSDEQSYQKFSDITAKYLEETIDPKYMDPEWIKVGTNIRMPGNFDIFELGEDEFNILFNINQVASENAGHIGVKIPYSELQDILKENGPVSN